MNQIPSDYEGLPRDLHEIVDLAGDQENGIPKGLIRCHVCGGWVGRCLWPNPLLWNKGPIRVSCRCEAHLCVQCGEPVYEYRLGANVFDESTRKIVHIPGMLGSLHHCGKPRIEMPQPIRSDWGGEYAEALAGFPVQLVYIGVRLREDETHRPIIVKARYFFDPGSFREGNLKKEMIYHSHLPSEFYVRILWHKETQYWETFKCVGSRLLFQAAGTGFEEAMRNTLAFGIHPDESAQ